MNRVIILTLATPGKTFQNLEKDFGEYKVVGGVERKVETYIKILSEKWEVFVVIFREGQWYITTDQKTFKEVSVLDCLKDINPLFVILSDEGISIELQNLGIFGLVKDISVLFLISQLWQHVSSGNSFRGILANGAVVNTKSVLKVGAIYDSNIFYNSKISRENIAIYVGRLDPNKNINILISMWKKIYEKFGTKLFLIGGTHVPDYFNTIKNQIDGNKIEHIFWLSTSELKNYYDTCCLSIMPSKRESLCWSVVESLACGCTCVIDGEYTGMGHEIKPYIVGESLSWTNSLDKFVYNALEQNIKKDASEYMKGYSIKARKNEVISFIEGRL